MRHVYKFNHHYKDYLKQRRPNAKFNRIRSRVLVNPHKIINGVAVLAALMVISIVIISISKKHLHSSHRFDVVNNNQPQQVQLAQANLVGQSSATQPNSLDQDNQSKQSSKKPVVTAVNESQLSIKTVTVKHGDNLTKIFKRLNLDTKLAINITSLKQASALHTLHAGKKLTLAFAAGNQLAKITYPLSVTDTLIVTKTNDGKNFQANVDRIEPTARLEYAALTVNGSLYASARKAGISGKLITQLVNIFKDKTNLNKTLHAGDKVAFLYQDMYVNDKKVNRNSNILAAEYTHAGKINKIVAFTDPHGITDYYTADGYAIKSPFVRYPLKFKYISSPFSHHRYNPILHIYCEHTGVDLVAPVGTPIKASSNGIITSIGMNNDGYGKKVIIKHGKYSTLYAHMRGFATGLHKGSSVHQGQLIGYVGLTGHTTGPHLHYEFRINNVPHDPVKTKLPSGELIAKAYRGKFFAQQKKLFAQLDLHTKSLFAANNIASTISEKS